MTTTTLPADIETIRLAEHVARVKCQPVETVVREATQASAAAVSVVPTLPEGRRKSPDEIVARVRSMPVLDTRSPDEILD